MLILPKWLNKWLTPEEEQQLKDPSRRVFTLGLLASAALLTVPSVPVVPEQFIKIDLDGMVFEYIADNKLWNQVVAKSKGERFNFAVQFVRKGALYGPRIELLSQP